VNILHLVPYYAPAYAFGGVVSALEGLTQAQVQQGHSVTVLTTDALTRSDRLRDSQHETRAGVQVIRIPNALYMLRRWNLSSPLGLPRALEGLSPDVIHVHEFRTVENFLALPTLKRVPTVLSPHATLRYDTGRGLVKQAWDRLISPRVAPAIRAIVALTAQEQYEIEQVWRTFASTVPPIHIVPNGVDLDTLMHLPDRMLFRQKHHMAASDPVILFMGRLHARKGVEVLVKAFQQANLSRAWLVLAGPDEGMEEQLRTIAGERVIFTGFISGEERLQALSAADLFVLPAVGEGLSMAVLEALAAGLPVILSPGCNMPQTEARGAGLIVNPDIDSLVGVLTHVIGDEAGRAAMGRAAQVWAQDEFAWPHIAAQMTSLYDEIV
jgi:glycosyltransferase involved in cell wall biosynthesis